MLGVVSVRRCTPERSLAFALLVGRDDAALLFPVATTQPQAIGCMWVKIIAESLLATDDRRARQLLLFFSFVVGAPHPAADGDIGLDDGRIRADGVDDDGAASEADLEKRVGGWRGDDATKRGRNNILKSRSE